MEKRDEGRFDPRSPFWCENNNQPSRPISAIIRPEIGVEHRLDVPGRDVVVVAESAAEILRDVHQLVDDGPRLLDFAQAVEPLGDEFQDIEGFDAHGDLENLAHPVAAGDNPPGRRSAAPDADDFIQIDVAEPERPDDVGEAGLDVGGGLVADGRDLSSVGCQITRDMEVGQTDE